MVDHVMGFDFEYGPVAQLILDQKVGEVFADGMAEWMDIDQSWQSISFVIYTR